MRVKYMFDVVSPYAALSWRVLRRYQKLWDIKLELKPVFLGGIMRGTGNKPPATVPARGAFMATDLDRNARFFNVPMQPLPSNFFSAAAKDVLNCQRLIVAAQNFEKGSQDRVIALVDSLTTAVHLDPGRRNENNELFINEEMLLSCCASAGFSAEDARGLVESRNSAEVKAELTANTEEAIGLGLFGVPAFILEGDDRLYFGSDRFEQMAFLSGKPWHGPDPERPTTSKL